jgi:hypothetical protein
MASDLGVISFGTEFCNTAWDYNFRLNLFTYQMEKKLLTQNKVLSNIRLDAESFPGTFLHFE